MKDKAKLKRVLQFPKKKINEKWIIGTDNISKLCTWANAVYGVHPDMKIHTGGGMLFGYVLVHCKKSKKIKHKNLY